MKNLLCIPIILASLACTAQSKKDDKAVLTLSARKFEWMIHQNFDSLRKILDDGLIYIHSNGWKENKKEFLSNMETGKISYTKITVDSTSLVSYPATAIVSGRCVLEGKEDQEPYSITISFNEVYVKKTNWKLVLRDSHRIR